MSIALGCSGSGGGGGMFDAGADGAAGGNPGGFGGVGAFGGNASGGLGASAGSGATGGDAGDTPCANGGTRCDGVCVSLSDDPLHCGSCDKACALGELCQSASCVAAPDCTKTACTGLTYCDLSTGLCKPGCADSSQCGANEVCNIATHACDCSPGYARYPSGVCGNGCEIGGVEHAAGATNPGNVCERCAPEQTNFAWTPIADGTPCGVGLNCYAATCMACLTGSACTPANACHEGIQQCSAAGSSCSDTGKAQPNGSSCGTGKICNGGSCQTGCWVNGLFYASGAASPSTSCQTCQPSTSTTSFSSLNDGTSCGSGKVCHTGACEVGCFIGGSFYTSGQKSPTDGCKACIVTSSTSAWSSVSTGTTCDTAKICNSAGSCVSGCWISGAFYAANALDPSNGCRACLPNKSTSTFSNDDGAQCGSESVCFQGSCKVGCYCPTQFTSPTVLSPGTTGNYGCAICDPKVSTQCWSPNPYGGKCWFPSGCCGYCSGTSCQFSGCGSYC